MHDITRTEAAGELVRRITAEVGPITCLVNNAGIHLKKAAVETTPEEFGSVLRTHIVGAHSLTRAVVPGMKSRKWGRIINVCSAHSLVASPYKVAYVAAKHGLAGLTKVVALELAETGITVNAVSPGFVWTPLVAKQIPDLARSKGFSEEEAKRMVLTAQPTKRFVTVEELGALAAFLSIDAAASITGANYSVDGGWTAQ